MRKTLLTVSALLAGISGTLAYVEKGHAPAVRSVATAAPAATVANAETPVCGVSIGTVEAQNYSDSGLNLNYFSDAEFVAQTSEGTYMGFRQLTSAETGEPIDAVALTAISSADENVTIPDAILVDGKEYSVVYINSDYYFSRGFNSNIKTLTIPASVYYIDRNYSFDSNLTAIYMLGAAPSVTSNFQVPIVCVCDKDALASYIDNPSFSNSTLIPYGWEYDWVTVNVEKAGEFAETYLTQNDYDWGAVQNVKVTGNINDTDLSAIKNLTSLMKLDLSETTITALPSNFMYNRSTLLEVKLPSTLASIGEYAFYGCKMLQAFDLNGITTIGNSVFSGCESLPYINLQGVETIGNYAFQNCTKLSGIDLSTVRSIGSYGFGACTSLGSADLTSLQTIDSYAFSGCTALKEVTFGNGLATISSEAFYNTGLEKVVLPEGLSEIGSDAFRRCVSLKSVEMPSTLSAIQNYAFRDCTSLSQVEMKSGLISIGNQAFYGCTSLEEVAIPSTVTMIASGAFNKTGITSFKCYAAVPPSASESFIGSDMDMSRTFLYVPPFSKDFYRNTTYWSDFYLMRSIDEPVEHILIDRPLTINLEEEDNAAVAGNPSMRLTDGTIGSTRTVAQLTAMGEGTLSAGELTIDALIATRYYNRSYTYCPTLINYADKMRADNVTLNLSLYTDYYDTPIWRFISLPFDVKVSDIVPSENTYWVIRRYDSAARAAGETSETWVDLTADDTMEAGKGYILSAARMRNDEYYDIPTLSFTSGNSLTKNNIFRSTDVTVQLSEYAAEFAHNRSWNLVGNPYPAYFDMHSLNEEFTAPVTIWNGRAYVAYSPVDDDLVLAPFEAFFVQCPLESTEMTFKETGRMHSDEGKPLYKKPTVRHEAPAAEGRNIFNFEVSAGKSFDRARIVLNPEAAMEYEIGRDASKFFAEGSDGAQIYVAADVNCSIAERPVADGLATLGIRTAREGEYTLALTGNYASDWKVMLTDTLTGISVDLTATDYTFTATAGDSAGRFAVSFLKESQTGIDTVTADFGSDTQVSVTSLSGVSVYTGRADAINVPAAGIYIVTDGSKTRKAILK